MQDKKLLNITHAVVGEQGVYSIEFHEDNHTTHVKRANGDMSETLFTLGGGGGGTTYTAGTGIDITNGVISSTVVDTDTTYTAGTGVSISNNVISSTVTDTNTFVSNVVLNGSDLEFTGTGGAFNGTVPLSSLSGTTENNIIAYTGGTINTDTVSLYGIREGAEKLVLSRSASSDVNFVLQGGTGTLGTGNFGIITVQVTLSCSGTGGILLKYKDLNNNNVNVRGGLAATSGNFAITFAYFGATGLQLIAANEY
jgi:hypothetical protein